jgi:DNA replicative helicase MCM subunit Mcm2 (Cdc46/Mcm family)
LPLRNAKNKIKNNKRRKHNYHFLKRYLTYASTIDVTFRLEAEHMIMNFWLESDPRSIFASHTRALDSLLKLAVAQARLLLKNLVDAEITKQTIEYYSKMIKEFGRVVKDVEDPRKTIIDGVNEIAKINKSLYQNGLLFQDAVEQVRDTDDGIKEYLGDRKLTVDGNRKYRDLGDRFLEKKTPIFPLSRSTHLR